MRSERHRVSTISVRARLLGETNVKAVILAGGFGTRIAEENGVRPKPMVEIGGRPILWHIMKIYSAHGITDFIVCLRLQGRGHQELLRQLLRARAGRAVRPADADGDERQFCSPGFDLPVGALTPKPADTFPGYHSSADDLDFVRTGVPRRLVPALPRDRRRAGDEPALRQPESEGRAAARQAGPLSQRRRRVEHRGARSSGFSTSRTGNRACSTSPTARASPIRRCGRLPRRCGTHDLLAEAEGDERTGQNSRSSASSRPSTTGPSTSRSASRASSPRPTRTGST